MYHDYIISVIKTYLTEVFMECINDGCIMDWVNRIIVEMFNRKTPWPLQLQSFHLQPLSKKSSLFCCLMVY